MASIGDVRRFLALPAAERRLVCRAAAWLPLARLLVAVLGHPRAYRWLCLPGARPDLMAPSPQRTAELVAMAAARLPGGAPCLPRSLVLVRMLAARGIPSDLRIGVRKDGPGFSAHAWVECEGVPLNEDPLLESRFAAFPRALPAVRRRR